MKMNENKRKFMKLLPMAAIAGASLKLGDVKAEAIELKPAKRYVFRLHGTFTQDELNAVREALKERGFGDVLVVSDAVDIYELGQ